MDRSSLVGCLCLVVSVHDDESVAVPIGNLDGVAIQGIHSRNVFGLLR